jgi:hypothetical protein
MLDLPPPKKIDAPEAMAQWAPHIRQHVLLFDLISALRFQLTAAGATLQHAVTGEAVPRAIVDIDRPPPEVFKRQVLKVEAWAELREERASEILSQLTPQYAFWSAVANLQLDKRPKTLELIGLALSLASFVEMRFKHALACARPADYSPNIQPIIPTPLHGSLPSGHATEAFMVVHLLEQLLPQGARHRDQLQRLAARTSINRTVAGVHFPVDSLAGQLLGQTLGEYLVHHCRHGSKAGGGGGWQSRVLGVSDYDGAFDFLPGQAVKKGEWQELVPSSGQTEPRTALGWLWDQAWVEWIRS